MLPGYEAGCSAVNENSSHPSAWVEAAVKTIPLLIQYRRGAIVSALREPRKQVLSEYSKRRCGVQLGTVVRICPIYSVLGALGEEGAF